ncbi:hypothetical protein BT63DRAFT_379599 [Microthyrium microscopicum]|uniref:DUF590-domain-containing protein n=1 Tax=Microthyrium microscopicum TaxID=703497 RepID=A0A6A6TY31_9PEZI|nr:hypothetical protein BT63DRAFT_379599 [Microthyrium microscopicum]
MARIASALDQTSPANPVDVDYVITYRYGTADKEASMKQFEKLVEALGSVGLATEVRPGEDLSLLVFVKEASEEHLHGEVYRSRVKDWIHNVRSEAPEKETKKALEAEPLYEAERLRIIYQLITNSKSDGGAGVTPKSGEWKDVEAIFALHDRDFNRKWIKQLSSSYLLNIHQLDEIRNRFGEKVAFYFAFIQSYFQFLLYIAAIGASAWAILGHFSPIYAIINGLGCIAWTEYWKHQEVDLAIRWGVRNVSKIESQRQTFTYTKETTDPVTGEKMRYFSPFARLQRQLLQIPFALVVVTLFGCLIAMCFGIEVFISEVYNGPLKSILVFIPTGILTTTMPILTGVLQVLARKLTDFENYETEGAYATALTQKLFVMDLVTSYWAIFLTAFVYVPFGNVIVPYLDVFALTVQPFAEHDKQMQIPERFNINPDRLRKQVIYFTVTAQIVNFLLELIVPIVKRRGTAKYKQMKSEYAMKHGGAAPQASDNDSAEEAEFLASVRKQAELPAYDVGTDIREMVIQFGYLALWSVVWPLTACSFVINDWIELRADAVKICVEYQRPIPTRTDTIGPWLDSLSFLTWLGSLTTAALVYMFSNDGVGRDGTPHAIKGWAILLTIFTAEQTFLVVRWAVRTSISKIDSSGRQKERAQKFMVRKRYIDESVAESNKITPVLDVGPAKLDRESLENIAREGTLHKSNSSDRFWARQRGWRETAQVGSNLIERYYPANETKKEQ